MFNVNVKKPTSGTTNAACSISRPGLSGIKSITVLYSEAGTAYLVTRLTKGSRSGSTTARSDGTTVAEKNQDHDSI